ncbi:exodeoxyribonuclease V subunit beta [Photobacterium jeanii]|uniref:RecBCD enzyme subunit RecB n=1 Tax=Photobacterium jeanii TaxID=858640 RepID=A0A178KA92_9GAMM|nr:exodeoxyribonuclease V subunit beta [Photobacterium jeanii]OAN14037.1 exodeoxyribonuclease V subunit beta [Photobacterium jeanii]PST86950.1 exodeoxyribonuclease V subunit beta [Photobacterium jeanii]
MNNQANTLHPMTFPLHGARLIEASAGTGKTFTIASLYLRLLLGHGSADSRHHTELNVDQILVVTFTEAATAELRDRIRARIHDARLAFSRGVSDDPVIQPLLAEISDHKTAAQILLQAERQMDEAAIYTIHGFCQRMLTQNAFESGSRFNNEFVTDESQLKSMVIADYWRRTFYHLPHALAQEVRNVWASPAALLADIGGSLTGAPVKLSVEAMTDSLAELHQTNLQRIDALKAQWREHQADFEALIAGSGVNKRSYTKKSLPTWLAQVNEWAATPTHDYELPDKLERFHQQVLIEKSKDNPPQHPVFVEVGEFLDSPANLRDPLLAHAIQECRQLLAQAKSRKGWLSFDDLLTQLSAAIDNDSEQLLVERIRGQYPVAMIDEFQDTDPLQYSIFSNIYTTDDAQQAGCGLFMIGDPKQAIYAFRGADIFTYIQARRQVTDHYTLGTNWRSTADMIASVNQVFEFPDSPFMYDQDIQFLPVAHSPKAPTRSWWLNGESQHALTFWLHDSQDDKPVTKGEYQTVMAAATAAKIQDILTQSQQETAFFQDKDSKKSIQAGDIAVLVRTGSEGKLIRQALAEQGIASVYLSNRDSVFGSYEAADIQRLLQAVLTPENDRALRAALASSLFAYTAAELDQLNNDENRWENAVTEFKDYRKLWLSRGVMPMLRAVMSRNQIAERLLAEEGGERRLTDLLHIGELLQEASQTLDSDYGLLRWLAEHVAEPNGNAEDQIQRLESERNLVQIVTIHKSKGLEYDLVFMPFVCSYRQASEAKYHDEAQHTTILDITAQPDSLEKADKERLAEDLRLIYVALTRAVYGCFVGMTPIRNGRATKGPTGLHLSAMGYLVQNGQEGEIAALELALAKLAQESSAITVDSPPVLSDEKWQPLTEQGPTLAASHFQADIERNWWMTSYSSLVKQGHQHSYDSSFDLPGFDSDSAQEATTADEEHHIELEPEYSIYTFPRGARPGTFLHTVFEEIEFTAPVDSPETVATLTELLVKENYELAWLPVLQQLIRQVMGCALDGDALRLGEKTPSQRLTEMEFLLPIELLSAPMLTKVIAKHDQVSAKAGELGFATVSGMLKGFIDLVFEHQGKYYVLDWKSNHLGDDPSVYHGQQLVEAMRDHRYDLQYQIYALALQRFLRSRIPDYDYDTHFGGVYYLFLRGITAEGNSGIFHAKPSEQLLTELEKLIDGEQIDA